MILITAICSVSVHADTCPKPDKFKLQPQGFLSTEDKVWHSETGGYKDMMNNALPIVFQRVTVTEDANGDTKVGGCHYEIRNNITNRLVVRLLMLPPESSRVVIQTTENWSRAKASSSERECVAWGKKTCEFTFLTGNPHTTGFGEGANPFGR
jgi:hypothetical protein